MKTLKLLIISAIFSLASCVAPLNSTDTPLDVPQSPILTVEELHGQNLSDITGNPTFDKTVEIE